ncbi:Asp/Glu/hydantoin racemase [Halanaerobium saccharolyticum]|uniref:Asp/Glu/hydantoin racemase n=1 Tax=Halanaerobium saccharolyticum TaxID=43595 RepID=A0A4R7YQA1_9FIRM|nr:aspartate/glutamate racemase family protein [Halanaerobium saccharolyticum]RAK04120.1 Asp/Glu/hydantoin racemase [Halanaerobium saccharolyticum]TDV97894.1 Asp/Glu/hydantoin racemase [Halanaerobium saccharolyticum]TDX50997.1 Asp/Glu/hydantoin racemase [Halanaerobium saccharolyticum]
MAKIALIHTTPVTVESLQNLIKEKDPDLEIINIVDDSILPELINNKADLSLVEDRVRYYIKTAVEQEADLVLSACSSIGGIFEEENQNYEIPIMRIDSAMAEKAVKNAAKIGVAATLETTLKPSTELIKKKAAALNKGIDIKTALADSAYQKLMAGDQKRHDQLLAEKLKELAAEVELVVLAQASMARAVSVLPEEMQDKFLTSPESGIEKALKTIAK